MKHFLLKKKCSVSLLISAFIFPMTASGTVEFFVDQGHHDAVNGVMFAIVSPHLYIKKAFKLRDENLSSAQLLTIREAMPEIAAMTHRVLNGQSSVNAFLPAADQPRSVYRIQSLQAPTQLYVKTLKNWKVSETAIQFTTDYFYSKVRHPTVNFRDNYVFTKTASGWKFSNHATESPDGVLFCSKTTEGWMRCELPAQ